MTCLAKNRKCSGKRKKMLVTSISAFYNNILKSLLPLGHMKNGLCGKGLVTASDC